MDQVVQSYVSEKKFMGSVLVARGDETLFSKGYGSANKGDILTIDFLADGTTQFGRNAQQKSEPIPGRDFQRALLSIWLGPKPIQADLKKAMLGG